MAQSTIDLSIIHRFQLNPISIDVFIPDLLHHHHSSQAPSSGHHKQEQQQQHLH